MKQITSTKKVAYIFTLFINFLSNKYKTQNRLQNIACFKSFDGKQIKITYTASAYFI